MASRRKKQAAEQYLPLKGLKVLELASVLAGPSVGTFLAELGADVLKIENPLTGGDVTRKWKLKGEDPDALSSYFRATNQGKRHLFLDIGNSGGRKIIRTLLKQMDVLITNFKPGGEKKFGLSASALRKEFPKLINASISGYGPGSDKPAFDICLQAESGFMSMNGLPSSGPIRMPVAMIDILAAHQLKEGILAALFHRKNTGRGRSVHVSLFDSALVSLAYTASNYFTTGTEQLLAGSLHPNIAPYGETIRLKDGKYLVLAVGNDEQFKRLCVVLKMSLDFKTEFATNRDRVIKRKKMMTRIGPVLKKYNSTTIEKVFVKTGIPFAIVRTIGEALKTKEARRLLINDNIGKVMRSSVFH